MPRLHVHLAGYDAVAAGVSLRQLAINEVQNVQNVQAVQNVLSDLSYLNDLNPEHSV
jgi:hypothetical protein